MSIIIKSHPTTSKKRPVSTARDLNFWTGWPRYATNSAGRDLTIQDRMRMFYSWLNRRPDNERRLGKQRYPSRPVLFATEDKANT